MRRAKGLTILDVMVLVLLIGVLLALAFALPRMGRSRTHSRQMPNTTQLRGIHQGVVMYASDNGDFYPGLDRSGLPVGPISTPLAGEYGSTGDGYTVATRIAILLNGNYFTNNYCISPGETDVANIHTALAGATVALGPGAVNQGYSFAMLDIATPGGRRSEWRNTNNSGAIVISDRNIGTDAEAHARSIWNPVSVPGTWRGSVVFNDNSSQFVTTHKVADTRYDTTTNKLDNLFSSPGPDDAMMIHP